MAIPSSTGACFDVTIPHPPTAVLLDAGGTLLHLGDIVGRLGRGLHDAGYPRPEAAVAHAVRVEIDHYVRHMHLGATPPALRELRVDCAGVLARALPDPPPVPVVLRVLMEAVRFTPGPGARALVAALGEAGVPVAVVSNWDCDLPRFLGEAGLAPPLEVVVASAAVGTAKPDPAIFDIALGRLGVPASRHVVHCGDDPVTDHHGARAAGLTGVLLDPGGRHPEVTPRVASLAALGVALGVLPGE